MVLRGSDAITLVDGQLRIASLSSLKHSLNGASTSGTMEASFKTLSNSVLDEALASPRSAPTSILLNPSKTLLSVSSPTSLLVLILPRTTALATSSSAIHVKVYRVGSFYFNAHTPRAEQIVNVKWHPWGIKGTSLLVLLKDGTLHEFDVSRDLAEPQQSVALLPREQRYTSPKVGFGFGSQREAFSRLDQKQEYRENDVREAVTFSLGLDFASGEDAVAISSARPSLFQVDWAPVTVYVLTTSGDVFAVAPFLPRFAKMSISYLHSLVAFCKSDSHSGSDSKQREYTLRFLSHLLKQAKLNRLPSGNSAEACMHESVGGLRETTPAEVLARGVHDQVHAGAGCKGAANRSKFFMFMDAHLEDEGNAEEEAQGVVDEPIDLVGVEMPQPPIVPVSLAPQGPFLLAPAPHELSDAREAKSTDMLYLRFPERSRSPRSDLNKGAIDALEVLLMAFDDGRVDLGVLNVAGKVAPRWKTAAASSRNTLRTSSRSAGVASLHGNQVKPVKSGRYGLSDSSDEERDDGFDDTESCVLPTLFIYESLNLGLVEPSPHMSPLLLTADPVYPDIVYVSHGFGVHMVCLSPWVGELAELLGSADVSGLQRFMHAGKESQARWIVKIQNDGSALVPPRGGVTAVQVVDDVYLGYSLLTVLGDGECIGIELSLREMVQRIDRTADQHAQGIPLNGSAHGRKPLYISLLGTEPFMPPAPFNDSATAFPGIRFRTAGSKAANSELTITPESLRLLGTIVQDLRGKVREVVQGGNAIQSRLELQLKELQRQVSKLHDVQQRIERHWQQGQRTDRIKKIKERQSKLLHRVDRVLQRAMDASRIGISQYEEAWLKEMGAMEVEVGRSKDEGLSGRVEQLRAQLEQLKPEFSRLAQTSIAAAAQSSQLGTKQMERILSALSEEAERLLEAKDKVHELSQSMLRHV